MADAAVLQSYTAGGGGYTHTRASVAVYLRQLSDTSALLPPALAADARSRALAALLGRLEDLDLTPLLVYRIDSAPAEALYPLAWQFGVTGLAGWDLARTEAERRALLRRAIELHRHKGTPWAIRQAFVAVGFPAIDILEHYGQAVCDGSLLADGQTYASPGGAWGNFAVIVGDAPDGRKINAAVRDLLPGIVATWKPARSRLVDMRYRAYRYDGTYRADGTAIAAGPVISNPDLLMGYTAGSGGYTHARAAVAAFLEQIPDLLVTYAAGDPDYAHTRTSTATFTASV